MARPRVYRHQVRCPEMRLQPDAQRQTFQRPPGLLPEMGLRAAIAAAATFPKPLIIAPAAPISTALWPCTGKAARCAP